MDKGRLDSCSIVDDGGFFLRKNGETWRRAGGAIFRNHRTALLSAPVERMSELANV